MPERPLPTQADVDGYLRDRRNWGRWGKDDQRGTINLITPAKRLQAASLVRNGRTVSLSRELPKTPAPNNPTPAQHFMKTVKQPQGGGCGDYYGISYHGVATTHLDSLCHVWNQDGMWNGRDPKVEVTLDGTKWGGVENWSDGIVTRGVLIDIPAFRGEPYVTIGKPVHGWEIEEAAKAQGVALEPGDAVIVTAGREAWDRDGNPVWGSQPQNRPGFHASCLPFLRDNDVGVLVWDMLDAIPSGYGPGGPVHGAVFAYGLCLIDNALIEPLVAACREERRYEFMFVVQPILVVGGTGSPVNPLAIF
jgi:hypothetical protein